MLSINWTIYVCVPCLQISTEVEEEPSNLEVSWTLFKNMRNSQDQLTVRNLWHSGAIQLIISNVTPTLGLLILVWACQIHSLMLKKVNGKTWAPNKWLFIKQQDNRKLTAKLAAMVESCTNFNESLIDLLAQMLLENLSSVVLIYLVYPQMTQSMPIFLSASDPDYI